MDVHNKNQILNQLISKLETEFILIDHGLCPDWSRDTHRRRRDTIYLILDGKGRITVNGETLYPRSGNMVLLPKNSMVSLYSENETCYNKYWCEFLMHFDGISLFDRLSFPYMIEPSDQGRALGLFERLDELHLKTDTASAFLIKAALLELTAMFLENGERHYNTVKRDPFAERVKGYIDKNLSEDLSVGALAREAGFNEKYFIEVFKKSFGTTPAQYVKRVRMEAAKNELLYSDIKILYIPNKIGYSSLQKLSKDFKAYTGFSPSEFRKNFK